MTLEAWIKLESLPTGVNGDYTILSKYSGATQRSYLWQIMTDGGGITLYLYSDGSGAIEFNFAQTFLVDTWYHVAMIYSTAGSGNVTFLLNAVSQGVVSKSISSIFNSTANFELCSFGGGNSPFDGKIEEVRIWNAARGGSDILADYNVSLVGNETNLAAYWPLNNTYNDSTSNANHLTPSGTPSFTTDTPFTETTTSTSSSTSTTSTSTSTTSTSSSSSTSTSSTTTLTSTSTTTTSTSTSTTSTSSSTSSTTTLTSTTTTINMGFTIELR